jgi:hypothetical protein
MNDEFLKSLQENPRPEFAESLYAKIDAPLPPRRSLFALPAWKPALAWGAGVAALALLFAFPGVRATAQDFLDLFRIKRFIALPIDQARFAQLKEGGFDVKTLLADDVEVLKKSGKPRLVDSIAEAGEMAGLRPRVPMVLPTNTEAPEIRVQGEGLARLTASTAKLRMLLDTLAIDDVDIPEQLDGATVTIGVPAAVVMQYKRGGDLITFVQSHSPEISLPEGVDLAQLGEIGLRITGMPADEAYSFARSVDWHGTLLVPVPANAASFREVEIQGTTGLLITTGGTGGTQIRSGPRGERQRSIVLWSDNGIVYAMTGGAPSVDLLAMANSVQ